MKKRLLFVSALLVLGLLIGGTLFAKGQAESSSAGKSISVLVLQGSAMDTMQAMLPEFEKQSGITVNWAAAPYDSMHQKQVADFAAHSGRYDVDMSDNPWLAEYAPAGWLLNLNPLLQKTNFKFNSDSSTPFPPKVGKFPTITYDDFITSVLNDYGNWGGNIYALPWMLGAQLLYYRESLFNDAANQAAFQKEFGYPLAVPKTWQQLRDVAQFFSKQPNMAGLTWSGYKGNEAENNFEEVLWAMGGDVFPFGQGIPSKDNPMMNMPIIDSPIALKAMKFWISLKPYMPDGAGQFQWAEITPPYTQGHAAMMIQWSDFVAEVAKSQYKDDTGYSILPGDPSAPASNVPGITPGEGYSSLGGWSAAINKDSRNADAAFSFLQWSTGLTMTHEQRLHYQNTAFVALGIQSTFSDKDTVGYKTGRYPIELKTYLNNVRRRPEVGSGLEVQTIIGDQSQEAFLGQETPEQALKNMADQLYKLMVQKGYIPASTPMTWPSQYVNKDGSLAGQ